MMKLAPSHVFNGVAQSVSGVGIFSSSETVTVFPGFTQMADTPACRGQCNNNNNTLIIIIIIIIIITCIYKAPFRTGAPCALRDNYNIILQ